ncbi:L-aspartate oxidase [Bacillus sp. FJAT-45350]|uniref:L-aspartate oxidase n=1 Tax=Bacillus sp. FJAT-45350 TaxID=2011014 RepID=UPI000BB91C23|nr:L-aspartate oxidase [Bacillus sp. FJAT-45350]
MMTVRKADVVIIGSGLAGLMAAEILSVEKNVIIITKSKIQHSNSMMAQGGIAAAFDEDDDWRDHFFDTIVAGGYHNDEEMTKKLVQKGPEMINKLIELGVQFDRDDDGNYSLGKEGAHGRRRILHAGGDATGKELVQRLINRVEKKVTIYEDEMALDLLVQNNKCIGVTTKTLSGDMIQTIAPHTILATGGVGQLYKVTSNCQSLTGDGMAMAYRAGAELVDMEFVQFHPTMLVKNNKGYGLISEAVRGEGARLVTNLGHYIMENVHELKDLAPRDVVAREIHRVNTEEDELLYLDISTIKDFEKRFPSITKICKQAGVQLEEGRIPVAPGAHFIMGGVSTNERGATSINGLYAIGEVSKTGVHGANRLASNSLLEAIVFANELAQEIIKNPKQAEDLMKIPTLLEKRFDLPTKEEIQDIMTKYVGIVRNDKGLEKAKKWFENYLDFIYKNGNYDLSIEQKTICNLMTIGYLITSSALMRNESRGGHYREDKPLSNEQWLQYNVFCSITNKDVYTKAKVPTIMTV